MCFTWRMCFKVGARGAAVTGWAHLTADFTWENGLICFVLVYEEDASKWRQNLVMHLSFTPSAFLDTPLACTFSGRDTYSTAVGVTFSDTLNESRHAFPTSRGYRVATFGTPLKVSHHNTGNESVLIMTISDTVPLIALQILHPVAPLESGCVEEYRSSSCLWRVKEYTVSKVISLGLHYPV